LATASSWLADDGVPLTVARPRRTHTGFLALSPLPTEPYRSASETGSVRRVTGLRAAFAFLTRVPVGRLHGPAASDLTAAAPWFPVVGLAVGGVSAGLRAAAGTVLPSAASTVIALAAAVVITGGLHEDGLADTADALGAHVDRARRLEILRDPRIGTFGALALGLVLLFSFAALAPLGAARFARAVVVAHVLARCSPLLQSRLAPPARRDGSGALLRPSDLALAIAAVVAAAVAIGIGKPGSGATALGVAALTTVGVSYLVRSAIGGTTGDTFGAGAKLVEVVTYGVFAAFWT
jgi:adenosylcobinamide-GDP ribazoletransferase